MPEGLIPARPSELSNASEGYAFERADVTPEQSPLERPLAAVRRYKWLILGVTLAASAAGVLASRFTTPRYEVRATMVVGSSNPRPQAGGDRASGPIRSADLLTAQSWIELFRSHRVVDEVVRKHSLYVELAQRADRPLFYGFTLSERFAAGAYELTIDRARKSWRLATVEGALVESGAAVDSVGRAVGFRWQLPPTAYEGTGDRSVQFNIVPPRDKSLELLSRVGTRLAQGSSFLWLTFADTDPRLGASILNTWVHEFLAVAAELKKKNVADFAQILEEQLQLAERATQDAESAYQNFRVGTIILPTEGGPVAARGLEERDPALASYFDQKIEYDNLRHDREALEQTIRNAAASGAQYEGLLFIPSVAQSPGAEALREAFRNQYTLQAELRTKQQAFTDEHPAVIEAKQALAVLRTQTIPQMANQLLAQLRDRESDYQRRISAASRELREIPPRTIEERRLSRAVTVAEQLYTRLKGSYAEAQLAEASAVPDVSVLDTAIAPLNPSKNTASMFMVAGVMGGLFLAIGLALLLDQLDKRMRYPNQATSELGLVVAGAVPKIPKGGIDTKSPEQVVQFLESFRTLRMHVLQSGVGQRLTLAVTSAAPGDGKSLISANLALSFAEAGIKTVLIDGDTRRGSLHRMHGLKAGPGLTEYLAGVIEFQQAIRPTSHQNLSLVSCGARHPRSPELLAGPRLKQMVDGLSERFDVVIFDTPPLAAGIDAYAISAAAGRVLMVLRMGQTERRLAAAKLATLDRLPVDIVGAVLNAVPLTGEFQYYSYSPGYSLPEGSSELVETGPR
ncbi:MAG TPA: polysaccharide biosynthesis tyrosine autokinase [Gemmatimonadaceae bacterium]|nr:polysaccharide biosynthesis tyrosine autokinase [Gemmatimonadaceae bacterium]